MRSGRGGETAAYNIARHHQLLPALEPREELPVASVRTLGLRIRNREEPGTPVWAEAERERGRLYEAVNRYMANFAHVSTEDHAPGNILAGGARCVCGQYLEGFLGSFTWGIQHGEGRCSCGHPGRGFHAIKLDGTVALRLHMVLPYHPRFVRQAEEQVDRLLSDA